MKALLDSSTMIAAMLPDHVHHAPVHAWLSQGKAGAFQFVVSGHSLAEVYAVLTTLPRAPRISPAEAWQMIQENVLASATVVTLAADDYAALVDELAQRGILGGKVYDAVIPRASAYQSWFSVRTSVRNAVL